MFLRDLCSTAARDPKSRYTCAEAFIVSVLADVLSKLVGTVLHSTCREELCNRQYPTVSQARVPPGRHGISRDVDRPNRGAGKRQRRFKSVGILFTV